MRSQTATVTGRDGHPLALRAWTPDDIAPLRLTPASPARAQDAPGPGADGPAAAPRAVIQVLHGMAEHSARYEGLARAATAAGCAVVANDHRGHGLTITRPDERGHSADVEGWELLLDDLARVTEAVAAAWPGVPRVVLGHSWGSVLLRARHARGWGGAGAPAGLIIMGTIGDPGPAGRAGLLAARAQVRLQGPRRAATVLHRAAFGAHNKPFEPGRTALDWLSRDEAAVDAYLADPLCGFTCTAAFYRDLALGGLEVSRPEAFAVAPEVPVLVTSGAQDPVGREGAGPRAVATAYRRAGVQEVALRLHPGARHELLHETNRDEVVAGLLTWADARL